MSFTITIAVQESENESVFLQRVIQVALHAYRKNKYGTANRPVNAGRELVEAGGNNDDEHR
jgi:hypothetical protein